MAAKGDHTGAGQGGDVDDGVRFVLLLHIGQRITQHQTAFSVGVEDLHGLAGQGLDDVARARCPAIGHVLCRCDDRNQVNRQIQLTDRFDAAEYAGGAAHVVFHLVHVGAGFQGDAAGIKGDAFAHQCHGALLGGFAAFVFHDDDLPLALRAFGNSDESSHAHLFGLGLTDHFDGQLFILPGQFAGNPGEIFRIAVIGGEVAQIAGKIDACRDAFTGLVGFAQAGIFLCMPVRPLGEFACRCRMAAVLVKSIQAFFGDA